jgi:REP element-mobilizing transposase RayT
MPDRDDNDEGGASLARASGKGRDAGPTIYRRHLPHWRLEQATYFVTWRLAKGQPELDSGERDLVMAAIKKFDGRRYELSAYVVMDDHVHVLLAPLPHDELKMILHSWKSFTARQMQREHKRSGQVWQNEYFDRIIRDDREFTQKASYIIGNPRKRWPEVREYPWVWPNE